MKKLLFLTLSGILVLSACGNNEDTTSEDNESKAENKQHDEKEKTTEDKDKENKKEDKKDKDESEEKENNKDENSEEESNQESTENDNVQNNQQDVANQNGYQDLDFNSIQDVGRLKSIIYGDYTEEQKLEAYNTAVSNGVIPQGNVMEGPASEAFESSMRIANGEEESIYDGLGEEDEDEIEKEREDELQDEYFEISDKLFEDDNLSEEEEEELEKRQDEILDEVEPIH
ncbi:hypothetical protein [Staphylococcus auricularis]|uniref:hypothetical protein n=1 Tax=Staphylococcus auricularis TaxID=29379 RepID=UPI00248F08FB|nr:hypothetical protein [Staphylococcus auricularis]